MTKKPRHTNSTGQPQKRVSQAATKPSDDYHRSSERMRRCFLVVLAFLGAALIVVTAFFGDYLAKWLNISPSHRIWEAVACLWSFSFAFYYFVSFKHTTTSALSAVLSNFLVPVFIIATVYLPYRALGLIWASSVVSHDAPGEGREWEHLKTVVALAIVYFFFDLFLWRKHPDLTQRDEYRESFFLADIPTMAALSMLCLWMSSHRDTDDWKSFASGVVAFQLITCNAIFVVAQLGLHRANGTHDFWKRVQRVPEANPTPPISG